MKTTLENIYTTLNISRTQGDERQLILLQQWCHAHISQEIRYETGDTQADYQKYAELIESYQHFLLQISEDEAALHQTMEQFNHLTPIQYAALKGYHYFIEQLRLSSPSIINAVTEGGSTALHIAASHGYVNTVRALLIQGADPKRVNKTNQLPIQNALFIPMQCSEELIANKIQVFRMLMPVTSGCDIHLDQRGNTLLHLIASAPQDVLSDLFLEVAAQQPAALNIRNKSLLSPMHLSILNHNEATTSLALTHYADSMKVKDKQGNTALHYAAQYFASKPLLEQCVLLDLEAVNSCNVYGKTPLLLAAEVNHLEAMDVLIAQGARVDCADRSGRTLLDIARDSDNPALTEWIAQNTNSGARLA